MGPVACEVTLMGCCCPTERCEGSPSYRRTRESLEVMRSCEGSCGRNCMPVIFLPRAVLPLLFLTSAHTPHIG